MQNFTELCRKLKEACSSSNAPDSSVQAITQFKDPCGLERKVKNVFKKYSPHLSSRYHNQQVHCFGCCPIDEFRGYDFIKVLCDMSRVYQHGDCLYFSIDGELLAAVIITQFDVVPVTIDIENADEHFKGMYEKLFDDDKIEKQIEEYPKTSHFYQKEVISEWRRIAGSEYHNFLTQRHSQFMGEQNRSSFQFKLWTLFFGVLATVASRISRAKIFDSTKERFPCIDHIPYAACIKFAFDKNESGKVSELLGEIGFQNTSNAENIDRQKAERIMTTAKFLISKVIRPLNTGGEEMWSNEEVEELAEEVKKFYS